MPEKVSPTSSKETPCTSDFWEKTLNQSRESRPTLFATDRTNRKTYIAQGWVVTDPQSLAEVGPVPKGEAIIEIPEDVLKFYARNYSSEEER